MKILLIGGFGYIGSTLVDVILESNDDKVTVLDTLEFDVDPLYLHGTLNNERVTFIKGDVANMRLTWELIKKHDVIVYLASLTLPNSAKEPGDAVLINRHMAEIVGDCCKKLNKHMIFMSTCSNYGKSSSLVDEDGDLLPVSIYAISKVDAEKYLLKNVPNITVLRCATAYGVGSGRTRWDVLFNDFVRTALSDGVIKVFQPKAHRPICHVIDIARAIYMIALHTPQGQNVYNVGSNSQNYTKEELAKFVAKATNAELKIVEMEDKRDYRVDFRKIANEFNYEVTQTPVTALPPLKKLWETQR